MILFFITLAYLAFWSPRWITLAILSVFMTLMGLGVLGWMAGLLQADVDYSSPQTVAAWDRVVRAVALNTLLYLGIGIVIVFFGKRRREDDARQLELLARLTKPPGES